MNHFFTTVVEKWPDYLLEILVIILGVLGAYMLNRWYERSKEIEKERKYLQSLFEDISNQREEIQNQIEHEKPILTSLTWLGTALMNNFKDVSKNTVNQHLIALFKGRVFNTYNSTFLDMQSSGNLDLLRNHNLKNNIIKFYKDLARKSKALAGNLSQEMPMYTQKILDLGIINIQPNKYQDNPDVDFNFETELESKFDLVAFKNLIKEENHIYLKNAISGKAMLVRIHLEFLETLDNKATSLISQFE